MKDSIAVLVFFAIVLGATGFLYTGAFTLADSIFTNDVSKAANIPVTVVNSERFTTFGGGTATKRGKTQSKSKGIKGTKGIKRKSHKKH